MKISELLKNKMTISFEVFPPKDEVPMDGILETLSRLCKFRPDFISCTYGAGGTNKGRHTEVCDAVQKSGNIIVPHFSCIGNSRDNIKEILKSHVDKKVENILALRGDIPDGWEGTRGDFSHADNLVSFIKTKFPQLCIAVTAYPEKHIAASSEEADITRLRSKQDKGAEFAMTQICFDIPAFERFKERIRKAGVTIPIVAGIMPVLVRDPVIRMTISNGCSIPADLAAVLGKYQNNSEDFTKAGIEYTVNLIHRYIASGIDGLHLYTLNKWEKLTSILQDAGIKN